MFNSETIKSLAHNNHTAAAVFLSLSERDRPRTVLNITLLKSKMRQQKVELSDKDFFLTFKLLEKHHIGHLIFGRKGNPTWFVWYYDLRDVAKIALGSKDVKEPRAMRKKPSKEARMAVNPVQQAIEKQMEAAASSELPTIGKKDAVIKVLKATDKEITFSIPRDLLSQLK